MFTSAQDGARVRLVSPSIHPSIHPGSPCIHHSLQAKNDKRIAVGETDKASVRPPPKPLPQQPQSQVCVAPSVWVCRTMCMLTFMRVHPPMPDRCPTSAHQPWIWRDLSFDGEVSWPQVGSHVWQWCASKPPVASIQVHARQVASVPIHPPLHPSIHLCFRASVHASSVPLMPTFIMCVRPSIHPCVRPSVLQARTDLGSDGIVWERRR